MIIRMTLLLIGFMLFTSSCSEPSFEEKYEGNWTISFTGDLSTNMPLAVGNSPGVGSGVFNISLNGYTSNYQMTTSISESGALSIDMLSQYDETGTISGNLNEDGGGNGVYNIGFYDVNANGEFALRILSGSWTANKN